MSTGRSARRAYAPRVARTPEGLLVLHTQQRRFGGTDRGPLVRGSLSQPKLLSFSETGRPWLAWWPGMEQFLEPNNSARLADGMALFRFQEPALVTMQLGTSDKALEVTLSETTVTVGYADGTVLHADTLTHPPRSSARILRYREFVEVYVDERFSLSHVAYAPQEPEVAGWADRKPTLAACSDFRLTTCPGPFAPSNDGEGWESGGCGASVGPAREGAR